ncbi:hypothetical protein ACFE04_022427 [Oxalis oulophora]
MSLSSHSSAATEVSADRLEEVEREIAKDGFLLHLGGKLKFNDEEKTAEYVGGGRHFYPARPDEMSMNYLKTYIVMPLIAGDVLDVLSAHFKKPSVSIDVGLHLVETLVRIRNRPLYG